VAGFQVTDHRFDQAPVALGRDLHLAGRQVPDPSPDLERASETRDEVPVSDALDQSGDENVGLNVHWGFIRHGGIVIEIKMLIFFRKIKEKRAGRVPEG
jgi:hypothetical protein